MSVENYVPNSNTWKVNGVHILLGSDGLQYADSQLYNAIVQSNKLVLDTNIVIGEERNVLFVMGRDKNNNLVSPMVYANSYAISNGTHANLVLESSFLTNANIIKFPLVNVNESVTIWEVPSSTTIHTLEEAKAQNILTKTEIKGWNAHYEFNPEGIFYLVYEKDPISSTETTATKNVKHYPRNDTTVINSRHMTRRSSRHTRHAILSPLVIDKVIKDTSTHTPITNKLKSIPVKYEVEKKGVQTLSEENFLETNKENNIFLVGTEENEPTTTETLTRKDTFLITEKGKEIIVPPVIEEVENEENIQKPYEYYHLQYAELFTDGGKYESNED